MIYIYIYIKAYYTKCVIYHKNIIKLFRAFIILWNVFEVDLRPEPAPNASDLSISPYRKGWDGMIGKDLCPGSLL